MGRETNELRCGGEKPQDDGRSCGWEPGDPMEATVLVQVMMGLDLGEARMCEKWEDPG